MSEVDERCRAFWRAWSRDREAVAQAMASADRLRAWLDPISRMVKAIDPGLVCELGPGVRARNFLCVTGEGNLARRRITARWRALGPADDAVFEYHPARVGRAERENTELEIGGARIAMRELRFVTTPEPKRRRLHVAASHPAFPKLDRNARMTIAFLGLDGALGEDDVERWIGRVEALDGPVPGAVPLRELTDAIAGLASHRETGAILQGRSADGGPLIATVDLAIKRIDHLDHFGHVAIEVPFRDTDASGMPTRDEAARLNASQDALVAAFGTKAVYIGRETESRLRTMHFHVVPGSDVDATLRGWLSDLPWPAKPRYAHDPDWRILDRW